MKKIKKIYKNLVSTLLEGSQFKRPQFFEKLGITDIKFN